MPLFTWIEDNDSRSATIYRRGRRGQSSYLRSWKIFGTSNDVLVHADIADTLWTGFLFWVHPAQPENPLVAETYSLDYLGDDAWQLQVTYLSQGANDPEQEAPLRRARSFDTGGGTQHITQAAGGTVTQIGSVTITQGSERRFPPTAPPQDNAIGVSDTGVAGVDIVVPAFCWTETYDVPHSYVNDAYFRAVANLTGTVNKSSFRGFPEGEVLFMGGSGSQESDTNRGDGPWTLSYKFVQSPNVTGQTIGSITGIEKKGHEYLWVRYEDDVSGNNLIKRPRYVYVNKVYRDGDFSLLGLG